MFKEPITDPGKKSKKGRLTLEHENGHWVTKEEGTGDPDKVINIAYYTPEKFISVYTWLMTTKLDKVMVMAYGIGPPCTISHDFLIL